VKFISLSLFEFFFLTLPFSALLCMETQIAGLDSQAHEPSAPAAGAASHAIQMDKNIAQT
jgi:hypothetical protein